MLKLATVRSTWGEILKSKKSVAALSSSPEQPITVRFAVDSPRAERNQPRGTAMNCAVVYGLASAVLFGTSTPLAKQLVGSVPPLWLAALLYLGAGVGLSIVLLIRGLRPDRSTLVFPALGEWRWIGGAIALGGIAGPVALMYGLTETGAATASLLLNLEAVLTALLAWFLFRENFDARIAAGLAAIVAGATVLSIAPATQAGSLVGAALVALACLCWALDNNLTRRASASDAVLLAAMKGAVAGSVNAGLAWGLALPVPALPSVAAAALVGFLGYGISLVLFILALRDLGTARAGAYFSVAPFFGAAIAIIVGQDALTWSLTIAAALMALGVWLHVSEHHEHEHVHEPLVHAHMHSHDEHHQHDHPRAWSGQEPHAHEHAHAPITHSHPHYPDVHHRHEHGKAG